MKGSEKSVEPISWYVHQNITAVEIATRMLTDIRSEKPENRSAILPHPCLEVLSTSMVYVMIPEVFREANVMKHALCPLPGSNNTFLDQGFRGFFWREFGGE